MKLYYIGVIKNESKHSHELCAETDLNAYSRFTRNNYGEFMTFSSKTIAERTMPGQRQDVEVQEYTCHAYGRIEGVCGVVISDHDYPALVAHQLLSKVIDEFLVRYPRSAWATSNPTLEFPQLKDYIMKYQYPEQIEGFTKIQKDLDDTRIVLHKTIESVLQRGEKLDDLVAKSDELTQARKQNSCCGVM